MQLTSLRFTYGLGFLVCLGLFIIALYFQFIMGLQPCPLCISQRIVVIALGIIMLIATIHNPKTIGLRIYSFFIIVFSLIGIILSGRQVWLQLFPHPGISSCGAGLIYMLNTLPFTESIHLILQGSGECEQVQWSLLGLSLAAWLSLFFIGFLTIAIWQIFRSSVAKSAKHDKASFKAY